jgi:hypothetical protein
MHQQIWINLFAKMSYKWFNNITEFEQLDTLDLIPA